MSYIPKTEVILPILQGLLASGKYIHPGQLPETKCERATEAINDASMIAAMMEGVQNEIAPDREN